MSSTVHQDAMLGRLQAEADEKQTLIEGVVEHAAKETRDLTTQEMEMVTRARDRISEVTAQMGPLQEAARIAGESRQRSAEIAKYLQDRNGDGQAPTPTPEYRALERAPFAGVAEYMRDRIRARAGSAEATERLELYHRAAAHQLTTDNPGVIPEPVLGPVISWVDAARPLVNALGARQLPGANWSRPVITTHTDVAPQSAEKTELVSQKMVIGQVPVSPTTYGGYLNISQQNLRWSEPNILDIVLQSLADQYAIETENAATDQLTTQAIAGPTLPTGALDPEGYVAALWTSVATILTATGGRGAIIAVAHPSMIGAIGPLFPPVNPTNAPSAGFTTTALAQGLAGSIAGIPHYVSAGMAANTVLVLSTAAAEVYEDRIGALQVTEPSVLGLQVAYAGIFAVVALEPDGLQKIVKTP